MNFSYLRQQWSLRRPFTCFYILVPDLRTVFASGNLTQPVQFSLLTYALDFLLHWLIRLDAHPRKSLQQRHNAAFEPLCITSGCRTRLVPMTLFPRDCLGYCNASVLKDPQWMHYAPATKASQGHGTTLCADLRGKSPLQCARAQTGARHDGRKTIGHSGRLLWWEGVV